VNSSRAAELLGVTRPTLYDLLGKHSIDAGHFGRNASVATEGAAVGAGVAANPESAARADDGASGPKGVE
jgi:hypothetical protein